GRDVRMNFSGGRLARGGRVRLGDAALCWTVVATNRARPTRVLKESEQLGLVGSNLIAKFRNYSRRPPQSQFSTGPRRDLDAPCAKLSQHVDRAHISSSITSPSSARSPFSASRFTRGAESGAKVGGVGRLSDSSLKSSTWAPPTLSEETVLSWERLAVGFSLVSAGFSEESAVLPTSPTSAPVFGRTRSAKPRRRPPSLRSTLSRTIFK